MRHLRTAAQFMEHQELLAAPTLSLMLFILHHEHNTAEWFPVSQAASFWCRDMQQPSPGALGSMCVCPYERHDMRKLRSNPK